MDDLDINLAADLGVNAAKLAIEAITGTAETVPGDKTRVAIVINALLLLESRRRSIIEALEFSPDAEARIADTLDKLTEIDKRCQP